MKFYKKIDENTFPKMLDVTTCGKFVVSKSGSQMCLNRIAYIDYLQCKPLFAIQQSRMMQYIHSIFTSVMLIGFSSHALTSSCSQHPWQWCICLCKPPRPSPLQKQPATLEQVALWEESMWHAGLQTPACHLSAEKPHWCDLWTAYTEEGGFQTLLR